MLLNRKQHAYRIGCFNYNLGDIAVHLALDDIFPKTNFLNIDRLRFSSRLKDKLVRPKAIVIGGGTIIKEDYRQATNNLLKRYPSLPFIVFGTGVADKVLWEYFGVKINTRSWIEMLSNCSFLGVRGPLSRQHLSEWGLDREVQIVGDLALWFAKDVIRQKPMQKRIGLNFGPSNGKIRGRDEMALQLFGARLLRLLSEDGWSITLFPMVKTDIRFMENASLMADLGHLNIHKDYLNLELTLDALSLQDVFLGEKLHSVILANCVHTPAIMLEYRTKCRDYMLSIDWERWTIPTDQLDIDLVYEKICEMYEQAEQLQLELHQKLQNYKIGLREAAVEVEKYIN